MADIFDLFKKIESKASKAPITHIVAGLGNIGAEYDRTRHNAGFMAIDYIADKCGVRIDRAKFHALVAEAELGGVRVLLMKPTTYMNNSGVAIGEAASFYKIPPENVIVLHDEISFDPGVLRIRRKGSAGGHNGLKSIIAHLGADTFPRVKIGVGKKPSPDYDLVDFVLGKFPKDALDALAGRYADIHSAVELMLGGRIEEAMNKYSG
ncbi:MAG: aminoacyl-tRNA hydrolase [Ruminococcaceae bacterium]|nr:aminoacyl-tRNA hydrolase [Oscillospiraceae bacterium]